jgi:acetate---CoA ligase (ADP-forming) subunit beta
MQLDQEKALSLLKKYGIPMCSSQLVTGFKLKSMNISYPVVLKTASPEVLHKSDIGAVVTGIGNKEALLSAAESITSKVKARYPKSEDIFLVQEEMKGKELIIGMKRDPAFGPVIMFGLGGIFVEVFKDVSFRIAPLEKQDALDMMNEIKGSAILKGSRGEKPVNMGAIADILLRVCKLSIENPSIAELDLNPVIVNGERAKAVDARIMGDFN